MRILILGPSGQIGYELAAQAAEFAEVTTAGRSDGDISLDVLDHQALENLFSTVKPDIVINAIAYTAVDIAESDQELCFKLNADLPAALSDLCAEYHCLLIHYSTDFVFDGSENAAWQETAATNPLGVYGKSKLAGEKAIQISPCISLILRTSWVYGDRGNNFMLTMLRLAGEREALSVVSDQVGAPSCSKDIAKATLQLCQRYLQEPDYVKSNQGLYHLTAGGEVSWHGFAEAIFELAANFESLAIKNLAAISTAEYPTAAVRPAYSVLDCSSIKDKFGVEMPHWKTSLAACIKSYYQK
ncbi:MAG: dTDP-4-dehydrorhamnose reductase [Gammaproteobacteria bacterium]|nr:MAG: dTDP-4-dehydrorhamnose reductase [Gammaproteobacteria bacterium]